MFHWSKCTVECAICLTLILKSAQARCEPFCRPIFLWHAVLSRTKNLRKKSYCRGFCLQNLKTDKKVLQPQKISSMYIEIFVSNLIWSPYYGCTVFLLWKGIVSNRWYLNRILTKQKSVQAKFVVHSEIQSNATVLMTHNKSKVISSCPV